MPWHSGSPLPWWRVFGTPRARCFCSTPEKGRCDQQNGENQEAEVEDFFDRFLRVKLSLSVFAVESSGGNWDFGRKKYTKSAERGNQQADLTLKSMGQGPQRSSSLDNLSDRPDRPSSPGTTEMVGCFVPLPVSLTFDVPRRYPLVMTNSLLFKMAQSK